MAPQTKKTPGKKKKTSSKKASTKTSKWGSKKKTVKMTCWVIEETANKIRAIAIHEGRSQGDVVSEYMSKLVNVKIKYNKSIVPIPKRITKSEKSNP